MLSQLESRLQFSSVYDIDPSFGDKGYSQAPTYGLNGFHGVHQLPDGRIQVLGVSEFARFMPDGTFDRSLGGVGLISADGASFLEDAHGLADGGFIGIDRDYTTETWRLMRYDASGQLDKDYASGGILGVPPHGYHFVAYPDGSVLYPSVVHETEGEGYVKVQKFDARGRMDRTWGNNGSLKLPQLHLIADFEFANDGSAIITDYSSIMRILPGGTIDTSFGENGIATMKDRTASAGYYSMGIDLENKIYFYGQWLDGYPDNYHGMLRFTANGQPDFGDDAFIDMPEAGYDLSYAILPNGDVLTSDENDDAINGFVQYTSEGELVQKDQVLLRDIKLFRDGANIWGIIDSGPLVRIKTRDDFSLGANGALTITTGDEPDVIAVKLQDEQVRVSVNGKVKRFDPSLVKSLDIFTGDGADVVTSGLDLPVRVNLGKGDDSLITGNGDDEIRAGDGDDTVVSGDGTDTLDAGSGADRIIAGQSLKKRTISGNAEDYEHPDHLTIRGGYNRIDLWLGDIEILPPSVMLETTLRDDVYFREGSLNAEYPVYVSATGDCSITTGNGDDRIFVSDGKSTVASGDGNDEIGLTNGAHSVDAGAGDDQVELASYGDTATIHGGAGNDTIGFQYGDTIAAVIYGDDGDDSIYGGIGKNQLFGGAGKDTLTGSTGRDYLSGGGGKDSLSGGAGNDRMLGGKGDDRLDGGQGNDTMFGGDGNDKIFGRNGNDDLYGDDGLDLLHGGKATDVFAALDARRDTLNGGDGDADSILSQDAGIDVLLNIERL